MPYTLYRALSDGDEVFNSLLGGAAKSYTALNSCSVLKECTNEYSLLPMFTAFCTSTQAY